MRDFLTEIRSRRAFLKEMGVLSLALPSWGLPDLVRTDPAPGRPVLVSVFLRGGADACSMLVPHQEPNYYNSRTSTAIPRPGAAGGAIDLDGRFGLHPALKKLLPWYRSGRLAAVHGVGRPMATRSHFAEQAIWDTGVIGNNLRSDGWINRYLASVKPHGPVRALCLGEGLVPSMRGPVTVQTVSDLAEIALGGGPMGGKQARALLRETYGKRQDDLGRAARAALQAMDVLRTVHERRVEPANGAAYPEGAFGQRLRQATQLIKADIGLEVISCDLDGWDTHDWQGGTRGRLASLQLQLAEALHAFATDLGPDLDRVLVLVTTEFGRTLAQNGTGGTDHGRAGVAWLLGGKVRGGQLHGRWPGIAPGDLHKGRELQQTTDFRSLLIKVLEGHLKCADAGAVFGKFKSTPLGLFA